MSFFWTFLFSPNCKPTAAKHTFLAPPPPARIRLIPLLLPLCVYEEDDRDDDENNEDDVTAMVTVTPTAMATATAAIAAAWGGVIACSKHHDYLFSPVYSLSSADQKLHFFST